MRLQKRGNVLTWIHTCPKRDGMLGSVLESVFRSDLGSTEVRRHPTSLSTSEEIETWWEEQLISYSLRAPYFLRLEDDVVVSRSILQRIQNWPALREEDFGIGQLYFWEYAADNEASVMDGKLVSEYSCFGPGLLFNSKIVPALVGKMRELRQANHHAAVRSGLLNLDTIVARACMDLGYSVYLHRPSLVDCIAGESTVRPGTSTHLRAKDFAED